MRKVSSILRSIFNLQKGRLTKAVLNQYIFILADTVKVHSAVKLPSSVVPTSFVIPSETPVTFPCTAGNRASSELNLYALFVAFSGMTVGVNVAVSPTFKANSVLSKVIPVTAIGSVLNAGTST